MHGQAKPHAEQSLVSSKPELELLYTTQALEPCAGKSSWGKSSNPQGLSRSRVVEPKDPQ